MMGLWLFWASAVLSGFVVLIFLNMRLSYRLTRLQEDITFILALMNVLAGNWGSEADVIKAALIAVARAYPRRQILPLPIHPESM